MKMDNQRKILIIDDDRTVCQSLKLLMTKQGYHAEAIYNPMNALEYIEQYAPELILLDMNFTVDTSGVQGLRLLEKITKAFDHIPIILITGWGTMELAVAGMKRGARDFITKPWDNEAMATTVRSILALENAPQPRMDTLSALDKIIGASDAIEEVKDMIAQVAPTAATVLITGSSGTGKELVAEAIHELSERNTESFVKVNLGGLSHSLFESELFGHRKGAFTGAIEHRKGRFEVANGGTIFLDEVGDLAMDLQVKLLRVLQERTFEPVGSSKPIKSDVRVISATHRTLSERVAQGLFREDLYYRLNLLHIHLPDLSERRSDIPLLAQHFIALLNQSYGHKDIYISDEAMIWLSQQTYPGNIRQLKNLVDRSWLLAKGKEITIKELQKHHQQSASNSSKSIDLGSLTLEEMEEQMIRRSMAFYHANISKVAESLGITRSALYRRLEKYNIERE